METKSNKIVEAIAGTLGVIHFMGQTIVDLSMEAEVKLVNKYIGTDAETITSNRQAITMNRQESILNKMDRLKSALNRAKTTEINNN